MMMYCLNQSFKEFKIQISQIKEILSTVLSEKLRSYRLPAEILIADRYINYTAQARKLRLEGDEWDVACAWQLMDMALRYIHTPTGIPESDAADNWENKVAELLELELDADLLRLRKNASTAWVLYAICIDRIALIESGEATEIRDLV